MGLKMGARQAAIRTMRILGVSFGGPYFRKTHLRLIRAGLAGGAKGAGEASLRGGVSEYVADKAVLSLAAAAATGFFTLAAGGGVLSAPIGLAFGVAVFMAKDMDLDRKARRRADEVERDLPSLINRLALFVNAGMTTFRAMERIASEKAGKGVLYGELKAAVDEVHGGVPEHKAYEAMAARLSVRSVSSFVSVLVQNMRKGNQDLVTILRMQAKECWEVRKQSAKRLGEEASTKLLLPMVIMFLAVLLVVATPAVISFNGF
ncbi:MAG: type II secretion system F family protein [Oscillospiraceae bacterium]|nr:type II secretion system F family protein [Oscillospiraceae bacterium]